MSINKTSFIVEELAKHLAEAVRADLATCFQTCITCDNFTEKTEICKLANARPPARVIASGCSSYDEKVPF